jgi:hypothetical protein
MCWHVSSRCGERGLADCIEDSSGMHSQIAQLQAEVKGQLGHLAQQEEAALQQTAAGCVCWTCMSLKIERCG